MWREGGGVPGELDPWECEGVSGDLDSWECGEVPGESMRGLLYLVILTPGCVRGVPSDLDK